MASLVSPGLETLDYFGPIEILDSPSQEIEVSLLAKGRKRPKLTFEYFKLIIVPLLESGHSYQAANKFILTKFVGLTYLSISLRFNEATIIVSA